MGAISQTGLVRQVRLPVPIAGREREQHLLLEHLHTTAEGGGRLVLIGGEAGIGKTTLIDWFAQTARQHGALVLAAGCYDLTATPPYGPWIEAFERYQPTGDAPSRPAFEPGTTTGTQTWFDTIQSFLSALTARQPTVLILEDLHWSDPASLDLLRHLARRSDRVPILLIGTYRDDEITREHLLFRFLPIFVREADAERLDLRRLDRPDIAKTLRCRYDLPESDLQRLVNYLASHSDGNPLFFTELLRTLESERLLRHDGQHWTLLEPHDTGVPPLLQQVIEQRLGRLEPDTRDALAIAAIIGEQPSLALWSAVGGLTDEQLAQVVAEATGANVLVESPDGSALRFSHALVREAIHGRIALPIRRLRHRQVADALLTTPIADPDEVAYHLQQAGDRRAIEWFVRAGVRSRRADAWITAAERFLAAATLLAGDDDRVRERGWLLFLAAYLLRFSDGARSIAAHDEAERLAAVAGDRALAAYANYARGAVRSMRADVRRGLRDLEIGVAGIDELLADHDLLVTEEQAMSVIRQLLPEDIRDVPPAVAPLRKNVNL